MDGRAKELREKLERALKEAAEAAAALGLEEGSLEGIPHYSDIELRAHKLGQRLSQQIQERQVAKLAGEGRVHGKCPKCGTRCELRRRKRVIRSIDGPVELEELAGSCPLCRRDFFPDAGAAGA